MYKHSCEKVLKNAYPEEAQAQDGDFWECDCGLVYVHQCDDAEGCSWILIDKMRHVK